MSKKDGNKKYLRPNFTIEIVMFIVGLILFGLGIWYTVVNYNELADGVNSARSSPVVMVPFIPTFIVLVWALSRIEEKTEKFRKFLHRSGKKLPKDPAESSQAYRFASRIHSWFER